MRELALLSTALLSDPAKAKDVPGTAIAIKRRLTAMTPRSAVAGLLMALFSQALAAEEFAFSQSCTLTLDACDMIRDGSEACPTGQEIAVKFWAEGDSFNMRVSGGAGTGFGKDTTDFSIGQGYFNDRLRVYYMLGQSKLDGVFWISVPDGASGAHLTWEGQEDYFSGTCSPME